MPRGRPFKEDARRRLVKVRLSDDEFSKLCELAEDGDETLSRTIRDAINLMYEMSKS